MNHNSVTFAIAAIVATVAAISVGLAVPQQALAYHHHNHNNGIKVDQQISQLNNCTGPSIPPPPPTGGGGGGLIQQPTVCVNQGDNQADISK